MSGWFDDHRIGGRPSDEELCLAARAGDRVAFLELYRRHQALAWRLAKAATLHDEAAVAAVADGVVHCVAGDHLWGTPFRTRLAWAVRNAALARSRRGQRGGLDREGDREAQADRAADDDISYPGMPGAPLPPHVAEVSEADVCLRLASSASTPPPELWALVQVAWHDMEGRAAL